ncbi:hypothetical protein QUF76_10380 [Desulfobacterales bacterium HSG16]|nr:hypothetical protein [Desulfobacterales bacterium HSG16]
MFTFFKKPLQLAGTSSCWLGDNEWVYSFKLKNITSPLDPSPLWVSGYSGKDKIVDGSDDKDKYRRLKDALDKHRATIPEMDERGMLTDVRKVFTDVVVRISAKVWNRDAQLGGRKLEILADNLSKLHAFDFGDFLVSSRTPSYVIMPDEKISDDDDAIFQFGHGVFVPGKDDRKIGNLEIFMEDENTGKSLPSWIFWEEGQRIERPAAIYAGQECLAIAASTDFCASSSPVWLSHGKGSILVNFSAQSAHGDGCHVGDCEIERKDNAVICRFTDKADTNSGEILTVKISARTGLTLLPSSNTWPIYSQQVGQANGQPDGLPSSNKSMGESLTLVRGKTTGERIYIEGIALPRIDTPGGAIEDLEYWTLWIDDSGKPVSGRDADTHRFMGFCAWYDKNFLEISKPGKRKFSKVKKLPISFKDRQKNNFELVASPVSEQYHAILQLPSLPDPWPVDQARTEIGRGVDGILLNLLDLPESLGWKPGTRKPGTLGVLGLSRKHAAVRLEGDKLKIEVLSIAPIFVLDENGQIAKTLKKGYESEYFLSAGERFIVGCYLLRFVI